MEGPKISSGDQGFTTTTRSSPLRLPRWSVRSLLALTAGLGVGAIVATLDPLPDSASTASATGPITVSIIDRSEDVPPLLPPVIEIVSGDGRVTLEQYATPPDFASGLAWNVQHPVTIRYQTWDAEYEPGLAATLDMTAAATQLRTASSTTDEIFAPLRIEIRLNRERATISAILDGLVLLEEELPRRDWWSERTSATQICAAAIAPRVDGFIERVILFDEVLETWSRATFTEERRVAEGSLGLQRISELRDALPIDDSAILSLVRGRAWLSYTADQIDELESDVRYWQSSTNAQAEQRLIAVLLSYAKIATAASISQGLTELWCAAG